MQTGRKILNLRCDRRISQQELARACDITPSALSKIEAGINSPRAHIIWKLARQLGVTVEYLLDEELPYPYSPYSYRQAFYDKNVNPESTVRMEVTREERAFVEALRQSNHVAQEIAMSVPELSVENMRMIHFLIHHSKISNPPPSFFSQFEHMVRSGEPVTAESISAAEAKKAEAEAPPRKRVATRKRAASGTTTSRRSTATRSTRAGTRQSVATSTSRAPARRGTAAKRSKKKRKKSR